jgi:transcription antitermination factor NusG
MLQSQPWNVTDAAEAHFPDVSARSGLSWYALRVRSQHDFKVQVLLEVRGVEVFLPTWAETVQWSDRKNVTIRPLFAGYVFARFASCEAADIIRIPGVVQILPTSVDPIEISDAEIESLRLLLASRLPVAPCAYVAGETVTIESGPLAGVSGVVQRTKGHARLVVRVPILRSAVNVEIDAATVTKRCTT